MFIWTTRLSRGRIVAGVAAAVLICGCVLTGVAALQTQDAEASATISGKGIKTNEDRIAYLASYGWEVSPEPISVEELQIPEEFDDTYTQYLDLQAQQGFGLTKYRGNNHAIFRGTGSEYETSS